MAQRGGAGEGVDSVPKEKKLDEHTTAKSPPDILDVIREEFTGAGLTLGEVKRDSVVPSNVVWVSEATPETHRNVGQASCTVFTDLYNLRDKSTASQPIAMRAFAAPPTTTSTAPGPTQPTKIAIILTGGRKRRQPWSVTVVVTPDIHGGLQKEALSKESPDNGSLSCVCGVELSSKVPWTPCRVCSIPLCWKCAFGVDNDQDSFYCTDHTSYLGGTAEKMTLRAMTVGRITPKKTAIKEAQSKARLAHATMRSLHTTPTKSEQAATEKAATGKGGTEEANTENAATESVSTEKASNEKAGMDVSDTTPSALEEDLKLLQAKRSATPTKTRKTGKEPLSSHACDYGSACSHAKAPQKTHQCWWSNESEECENHVHMHCALVAGDTLPDPYSLQPGCHLHVRRAEEVSPNAPSISPMKATTAKANEGGAVAQPVKPLQFDPVELSLAVSSTAAAAAAAAVVVARSAAATAVAAAETVSTEKAAGGETIGTDSNTEVAAAETINTEKAAGGETVGTDSNTEVAAAETVSTEKAAGGETVSTDSNTEVTDLTVSTVEKDEVTDLTVDIFSRELDDCEDLEGRVSGEASEHREELESSPATANHEKASTENASAKTASEDREELESSPETASHEKANTQKAAANTVSTEAASNEEALTEAARNVNASNDNATTGKGGTGESSLERELNLSFLSSDNCHGSFTKQVAAIAVWRLSLSTNKKVFQAGVFTSDSVDTVKDIAREETAYRLFFTLRKGSGHPGITYASEHGQSSVVTEYLQKRLKGKRFVGVGAFGISLVIFLADGQQLKANNSNPVRVTPLALPLSGLKGMTHEDDHGKIALFDPRGCTIYEWVGAFHRLMAGADLRDDLMRIGQACMGQADSNFLVYRDIAGGPRQFCVRKSKTFDGQSDVLTVLQTFEKGGAVVAAGEVLRGFTFDDDGVLSAWLQNPFTPRAWKVIKVSKNEVVQKLDLAGRVSTAAWEDATLYNLIRAAFRTGEVSALMEGLDGLSSTFHAHTCASAAEMQALAEHTVPLHPLPPPTTFANSDILRISEALASSAVRLTVPTLVEQYEILLLSGGGDLLPKGYTKEVSTMLLRAKQSCCCGRNCTEYDKPASTSACAEPVCVRLFHPQCVRTGDTRAVAVDRCDLHCAKDESLAPTEAKQVEESPDARTGAQEDDEFADNVFAVTKKREEAAATEAAPKSGVLGVLKAMTAAQLATGGAGEAEDTATGGSVSKKGKSKRAKKGKAARLATDGAGEAEDTATGGSVSEKGRKKRAKCKTAVADECPYVFIVRDGKVYHRQSVETGAMEFSYRDSPSNVGGISRVGDPSDEKLRVHWASGGIARTLDYKLCDYRIFVKSGESGRRPVSWLHLNGVGTTNKKLKERFKKTYKASWNLHSAISAQGLSDAGLKRINEAISVAGGALTKDALDAAIRQADEDELATLQGQAEYDLLANEFKGKEHLSRGRGAAVKARLRMHASAHVGKRNREAGGDVHLSPERNNKRGDKGGEE